MHGHITWELWPFHYSGDGVSCWDSVPGLQTLRVHSFPHILAGYSLSLTVWNRKGGGGMHCKDSGTSWPISFLLYSMLIYIGDSGILQPSTPMDNGLVPAPAVTWYQFMTVGCFGFLYPSATTSIVSFTWSVGPVSALAVTSIPFCLFHYSGDWSGSIPGSDTPGCAGNHVSHIHTNGSAHHFSSVKKILTLFQIG